MDQNRNFNRNSFTGSAKYFGLGSEILGVVCSVCVFIAIMSCDRTREPDPIYMQTVEIKDVNRDTIVSVFNEKGLSKVRIAFEETLSDTALVKISRDRTISNPFVFLLPIQNAPLTYITGVEGDSLFVKYEPLKKPISGNLKIEITFE